MLTVEAFAGGAFLENGYLATGTDGSTCVVIDPGASADRMVERIAERSLDLEAILLTHAHVDHVEGIPTVRAAWPDSPIYLHPADRALYDNAPAQAAAFGLSLGSLPPVDRDLAHGQRVDVGGSTLSVRFTPGHAPGHVIFHAEDAGLAFVGDVIFAGSIGRTDLPGGDLETLMRSIREHVLTLPDQTRLLTGHGPETSVRFERVGNPFLVPHYGGELA